MTWYKVKELLKNSLSNNYWLSILSSLILCLLLSFIFLDQFILNWFSAIDFTQPFTTSLFVLFGLAIDVLLPIPSSFIAVKASSTLGFQFGFFIIWFGLNLSCLLAYYIGMSANKFLLDDIASERDHARAQQFIQRYGLFAIVFLRAVPVLAETSVIAAGMARMPRVQFTLATLSANAGIALVYALLGDAAMSHSSIGLVLLAGLSLPLAALGVFKFYEKRLDKPVGALHKNSHKNNIGLTKNRGSSESQESSAEESTQNKTEIMKDCKQVVVNFDYSLKFTRGIFNIENSLFVDEICRQENRCHKMVCYVDSGVLEARPKLQQEIQAYVAHYDAQLELVDGLMAIQGGEEGKTVDVVEKLHRHMLKRGIDRHSVVVVIGGGAVLDTVGYAAATFHRGIRLVRLPTTVLAQNDAGVGVKNGVNAYGLKNLLGSFAPPFAVLNDSDFLDTLSHRDKRAGIAEALKVAAIRDQAFFNWIEANVAHLRPRAGKIEGEHQAAMDYMIKRCAELHLNQILHGGDPFEMGSARPLDYGHWSAHKIESLTNYGIRHGEAVAIGMALDTQYAANIGLLPDADAERFIRVIDGLGFDIWHPALEMKTENGEPVLVVALEEFRQHLGGQLCISLLPEIGKEISANEMKTEELLRACTMLKALHEKRNKR